MNCTIGISWSDIYSELHDFMASFDPPFFEISNGGVLKWWYPNIISEHLSIFWDDSRYPSLMKPPSTDVCCWRAWDRSIHLPTGAYVFSMFAMSPTLLRHEAECEAKC